LWVFCGTNKIDTQNILKTPMGSTGFVPVTSSL